MPMIPFETEEDGFASRTAPGTVTLERADRLPHGCRDLAVIARGVDRSNQRRLHPSPINAMIHAGSSAMTPRRHCVQG